MGPNRPAGSTTLRGIVPICDAVAFAGRSVGLCAFGLLLFSRPWSLAVRRYAPWICAGWAVHTAASYWAGHWADSAAGLLITAIYGALWAATTRLSNRGEA